MVQRLPLPLYYLRRMHVIVRGDLVDRGTPPIASKVTLLLKAASYCVLCLPISPLRRHRFYILFTCPVLGSVISASYRFNNTACFILVICSRDQKEDHTIYRKERVDVLFGYALACKLRFQMLPKSG
jgi:hypothetical protein